MRLYSFWPGSKLHLAVEGGGLPLSLLVTGANTNDSLVFEALLDDLPKGSDPGWRSALPARQVPRGQGLRPPPLPQLSHPPGDQGPHRSLWGGVVHAAGPPPLESRTRDRLAGRVPAAAHSL
jgi:hypothetical protein